MHVIKNWTPNVLLKATWTLFFSAFQRLEIFSACSHPPLSVVWGVFQNPQWMPEITESTKPYIY